jgi:hypothetical protein
MEDKDHPIIDKPWEYRIVYLQYDCSSDNYLEHFFEMWLEKDSTIRKLKFIAPRQIKIEDGFPSPTYGMEILDISNRGLENVNVWVTNFEASSGAVTLYAKDLIEIK